jgi:hypothetical protein
MLTMVNQESLKTIVNVCLIHDEGIPMNCSLLHCPVKGIVVMANSLSWGKTIAAQEAKMWKCMKRAKSQLDQEKMKKWKMKIEVCPSLDLSEH